MLDVEDVEDVNWMADDMEAGIVRNVWFRKDGVREGER
jgi:hypothetical protein